MYPFERALQGIRAAGFRAVTLPVHGVELLITPETPADEAAKVVDTIHEHDLELSCLSHAADFEMTDEEALASAKRQIDHCRRLGTQVLVDMGHTDPKMYDRYFRLMQQAAPYAADNGITIALKPHGGLSATAGDTLAAVRRVDHPAFRICLDPGNLFHYSAETPTMALPTLGGAVVAVGIRDHTGVGATRPARNGQADTHGHSHGMVHDMGGAVTNMAPGAGHDMGGAVSVIKKYRQTDDVVGSVSVIVPTAVAPDGKAAAPAVQTTNGARAVAGHTMGHAMGAGHMMGGGMAVPITPGDGMIDFKALFAGLLSLGFSGPCALESVTPRSTPEEIDVEVARAFRYISELVA